MKDKYISVKELKNHITEQWKAADDFIRQTNDGEEEAYYQGQKDQLKEICETFDIGPVEFGDII